MHPEYYIFRFSKNREHHDFLYTFIHTWVATPRSTSWIPPSWPHPRDRLRPSLAHTYLVSILFVLAHPVACCLSQWFIFHMYNPRFTTRRFNTFKQVNIMGLQYEIYNRHIYSLQFFFLCFCLTSGQTGWPQTFMSGTSIISIFQGFKHQYHIYIYIYIFVSDSNTRIISVCSDSNTSIVLVCQRRTVYLYVSDSNISIISICRWSKTHYCIFLCHLNTTVISICQLTAITHLRPVII